MHALTWTTHNDNNTLPFIHRMAESLVPPSHPPLPASVDDALEPSMQMFLQNVIHSAPDGNCGFRSIAHFTKGNQEAWNVVRQELLAHALGNRTSDPLM